MTFSSFLFFLALFIFFYIRRALFSLLIFFFNHVKSTFNMLLLCCGWMRHTFSWTGVSIQGIVSYGMILIHTLWSHHHFTLRK